MREKMFALASAAVVAGCSVVGVRDGYEEPPYEVVARVSDAVEVRRYGARLIAETEVPASDDDDGSNAAFRRLAGYIFGGNSGKASIAMTVPVETRAPSDGAGAQIAMTTPVEIQRVPGRSTMRFFLPKALTLETAPKPDDPAVVVRMLPGETLAVLRFTWFLGEETRARKAAELDAVLTGSPWRATGPAKFYGYDPPWTIPFLRRNEVVIPVTQG